jgi:outer membrane lipoprotein-sorting protein
MKSLQDVKTWAADVESTNDMSPQAAMKMQVKYAAPDNFQIETESGANKLQMISVGGEAFLQTNGKWQKAPASLNMEQMINNWRDMFSDQKLAPFKNIEFAGSETINGKDVSVYTYEIDQQAAMPDELKKQMTDEMKTRLAEVESENRAKIWIDRENNLPAKMEMTQKMSKPQQMTQKMSVNYIFDREIKIEAPKLP